MRKTFTILHTNDMHSNFIGMGPALDYTPFSLNDDQTRGGYARLAALIATRSAARELQGPVLVLDAGDYSMGTPFVAATHGANGLRRNHAWQPRVRSRARWPWQGDRCCCRGRPGTCHPCREHAAGGERPDAGGPATPCQRWRDTPPSGDRARRLALRSLRRARQGGHLLHQPRRSSILRCDRSCP
jgi:hypothetical protein